MTRSTKLKKKSKTLRKAVKVLDVTSRTKKIGIGKQIVAVIVALILPKNSHNIRCNNNFNSSSNNKLKPLQWRRKILSDST